MSDAIMETTSLTKRLGGIVVTDGVSLRLEYGKIHAIIGPNGAGKTSFINLLGGQLRPDAGGIRFDGATITALRPPDRARLGIARTFQVPRPFGSFAVEENPAVAGLGLDRHPYAFWKPLATKRYLTEKARRALETVGLAGVSGPATGLSHGDRRLLELAMVLAADPKVLLLDEPMAGLGHEDTQRMTALLGALRGRIAIVLVEHDMESVFALADIITVLAGGRVIASGLAAAIRSDPDVRSAYLGEDEDA